jgi:hypothetical protein
MYITSMLIKKMVTGQGILTEMEVSAWILREVHGKVKVIYLSCTSYIMKAIL